MAATAASSVARKGHKLTTEDRRRGALRAAKVKREKKASLRARLQTEVDKRFEELMSAYESAITKADPRTRFQAAASLIEQAYGKPAQEITGADGGPLVGAAVEDGVARLLAGIDRLVERRALEASTPELNAGDS